MQHCAEALRELESELREFCHDGLVQLRHDITTHRVLRGTWSGCVISYKRGAPGSCRRDRLGRARNPFTILWDNGWVTDEDVCAMIDAELSLRAQPSARTAAPSDFVPARPPPLNSAAGPVILECSGP